MKNKKCSILLAVEDCNEGVKILSNRLEAVKPNKLVKKSLDDYKPTY